MGEKRAPLTGEQVIGTFNNEERADVDVLKSCAAELVDHINSYGNDPRRNAIAITHVEQAAMMAVKSIFSEAP